MEEIIKTEEEKVTEPEKIIINDTENIPVKRERALDFFIFQLILTGIIILVFLIINIFAKNITGEFLSRFKDMTGAPTDELIENIADYAEGIIKR